MKRGAGGSIFLKTMEKVRSRVPNVTLRTSFIVGFPGESQADFDTLSDFVRAAEFDWMGVFRYSDEEGAKAHALTGKVPERTRHARERKLMEMQQGISRRRKQQLVGQRMEILCEGESEESPLLWEGRTAMHAPQIDGKVYISDFGPHVALRPGEFYPAEIVEAHDYDLVARIV